MGATPRWSSAFRALVSLTLSPAVWVSRTVPKPSIEVASVV